MKKIYTVVHVRPSYGTETEFSGTLERLLQVFSYTLEVGHSWNPSIPRCPKSIRSLVKALNDSANVSRSSGCYLQK